jgi:hypothetical protein
MSAAHILFYMFSFLCTAAPMTEYENARAQQIMANNRMFQRLGLSALSSLLKNACANREDDSPQKSGSEYNPDDNEGLDDDTEVVSKVEFLYSLLYTTLFMQLILSHIIFHIYF